MGRKHIKLIFQGKEYRSLRALAAELGVDHKVLKGRIDRGLPEQEWGKQPHPRATFTKQQLQELLDQRLSYPKIAERLGTTDSAIEQQVDRWNLKRPPALYAMLTEELLHLI